MTTKPLADMSHQEISDILDRWNYDTTITHIVRHAARKGMLSLSREAIRVGAMVYRPGYWYPPGQTPIPMR